jgi:hypothetical protein
MEANILRATGFYKSTLRRQCENKFGLGRAFSPYAVVIPDLKLIPKLMMKLSDRAGPVL